MHITLTIQSILPYAFIALIAAPLPILLLSTPLQYINEKLQNRKHYNAVKKYYKNPEGISAEQLKDVFPDKKITELRQIAYLLQEESSYGEN
jgi:hypothetical protein